MVSSEIVVINFCIMSSPFSPGSRRHSRSTDSPDGSSTPPQGHGRGQPFEYAWMSHEHPYIGADGKRESRSDS